MKWLVVAVCLIQAAQFTIANGVPVFVWGDTAANDAPVLSNQATHNLEQVLADDSTAKVIFVESQLNSNDFNYCSFDGKACFSYLGQQSSKFYSPSIESPVSYLRSRVWNGAVKSAHSNDDFSVAAGETVFVNFRDGVAHPTQNDRLAAHDAAIERIVSRLGQNKIVYIYTAIEDHEVRSRVVRETPARDDPIVDPGWQTRGTLFAVRILQIATLVPVPGSTEKEMTRTNLTLTGEATFAHTADTKTASMTIPTSPPVIFELVQDGGRWFVETVTHDGNHYTSGTQIGANSRFSFACTPEVRYLSPNETTTVLAIQGLQLEIDLDRVATTKMPFSESWNCVGFTSPGVWGGLFVTFLLLAIMTIGISWMLDIKTMDRFDDPKGKTIIINAQD